MSDEKCVVEGCNLEYDVVCSFSFYNVNTSESEDGPRQEWIEGAMRDESEGLWRHVSLQLCGYHFELDSQGLWIDSPMLPELLTLQDKPKPFRPPTEDEKKGYQHSYERFITGPEKIAAEIVRREHNYSAVQGKADQGEPVSRLNVRQLVDTLGYLSLKNLQRKQLWVAKVETEKAEASITQSEQVITKMQEPKQVIEIVPPTSISHPQELPQLMSGEEDFVCEIAEEQEITMEEVTEIQSHSTQEWTVNIVPEEVRPKYAFIKHCSTGKKKRHFTLEINDVSLQGDYENYYILPDADPSVGVEITTSYEPDAYKMVEYKHLVLAETPKKRQKSQEETKKKKKRPSIRDQVRQIRNSQREDWAVEGLGYDQDDSDDYDPRTKKQPRRQKL